MGYHLFVNLPLVGLAFNFDPFVPLAIASLSLSLGTCALAALQAKLPPHKRCAWSRPLVALLFFLQPIVRGWARSNWRTRLKSSAPVEVVPAPGDEEVPEIVSYWSDGSMDRLQFLNAVLARLDAANWLVRTDTGWTSHDFEVLPSSWIRLRFSTVTEELELGKKHFRCRLTSRWSSLARILLALFALAIAFLVLLLARDFPWIWFALMLLPLLGWFFESNSEVHLALFARHLDDTGSAHKLVRLSLGRGRANDTRIADENHLPHEN